MELKLTKDRVEALQMLKDLQKQIKLLESLIKKLYGSRK